MFRPPPIFRMRSIYEYITKSPGKPSRTWRPFAHVKRRGFVRQRMLSFVEANSISNRLSTASPPLCSPPRSSRARRGFVISTIAGFSCRRCLGKYRGSSNPREQCSNSTACFREGKKTGVLTTFRDNLFEFTRHCYIYFIIV